MPCKPLSYVALSLIAASSSHCVAGTRHVPKDYPTIQAAIDASENGDTVLVAPGKYPGELKIAAKNITLASTFLGTQDDRQLAATILDGSLVGQKKTPILSVEKSDGAGSRLIGFTIQNADHAVTVKGRLEVAHNRFTGNSDALSLEDGSAFVHHNTFENDGDDGIDMDGASEAVVEDNVIRNNKDDGIEIRLHKYQGPMLSIVIRRNLFAGNREDGLQLIDYPGKSPRTIRVERNVFVNNAMVAIGSMEDGNTKENFAGAPLMEQVFVINNTILNHPIGITGGDNFILLNNVIVNSKRAALRRVHGDSAAGRNLLWNNEADAEECDLPPDAFIAKDPLLDEQHQPQRGSPCIDGGLAQFKYQGDSLVLSAESFRGAAPDVGAKESLTP